MEEAVKERLKSRDLWVRALYMVFFAIVSVIVRAVVSLLAFVQFIVILLTGRANEPLLRLGANLGAYVFEIVRFVTFNTEALPFPFSDWPDEAVADNPWMEDASPAPDAPVAPDAPDASSDERGPRGGAGGPVDS